MTTLTPAQPVSQRNNWSSLSGNTSIFPFLGSLKKLVKGKWFLSYYGENQIWWLVLVSRTYRVKYRSVGDFIILVSNRNNFRLL
jgi:hypothetical protein